MMAHVAMHQVLGEVVESSASVPCANAKTTRTWEALVILCLFAHKWLAGSGEGPVGGAAVLAIGLTEYLDLGRVLDLQVLSMPKEVTIHPQKNLNIISA